MCVHGMVPKKELVSFGDWQVSRTNQKGLYTWNLGINLIIPFSISSSRFFSHLAAFEGKKITLFLTQGSQRTSYPLCLKNMESTA